MPSFIKDEMKKKDRQTFEDMQREIDDLTGERLEADAEDPAFGEDSEGKSPYASSEEAAAEGGDASEASDSSKATEAEGQEDELSKAKEEIARLNEALKEKDERVLRLQADFENFRRRTAKEKEEIGAVVTQEVIKAMLPLLDNFQRAMATETTDGENFRKGVEMISTQLDEILKKQGLEPIETEGAEFDPNFHQAVMRVQNPDMEDGSIAQELQKGYMVKGKVIRPSMVQVVSND